MDCEYNKLKDLFSYIYCQIKLNECCYNEAAEANSVLVFHSSNILAFERLISILRSINSNIFIYVISKGQHCTKQISEICKINYEIIEYNHTGDYNIINSYNLINSLKHCKLDKFIIIFNNLYGIGYGNILEILCELGIEVDYYAFNCKDQLLYIDDPALYLNSLRLLDAFCKWFWEYSNRKC